MKNRKMIYLDDTIDAIFSEPIYESGMKKRGADEVVPSIYEKIKALPSAQPEIIHCKDCIHRPIIDDPDAKDGFGLLFPDFRCPCRCDDGYYSWMPNDNWFCGNGERRIENDK